MITAKMTGVLPESYPEFPEWLLKKCGVANTLVEIPSVTST